MEISTECTKLTNVVKVAFDETLETTRELIYGALYLNGVSKEVRENVTLDLQHNK